LRGGGGIVGVLHQWQEGGAGDVRSPRGGDPRRGRGTSGSNSALGRRSGRQGRGGKRAAVAVARPDGDRQLGPAAALGRRPSSSPSYGTSPASRRREPRSLSRRQAASPPCCRLSLAAALARSLAIARAAPPPSLAACPLPFRSRKVGGDDGPGARGRRRAREPPPPPPPGLVVSVLSRRAIHRKDWPRRRTPGGKANSTDGTEPAGAAEGSSACPSRNRETGGLLPRRRANEDRAREQQGVLVGCSRLLRQRVDSLYRLPLAGIFVHRSL
jgi:hypothetical protein